MDLFSLPFISATLNVAYGILMALAAALQPVAGAASAAAAVIVLTLAVRAALIPTGVAQAKAEQTRARIAPKLIALQRKHKKDRERLQRETMQLYADEKASPFAGCVPVLIQAPVVGLIYALFLHSVIAGHPNGLLTEQLLGVPLGTSLIGAIGAGAVTPTTAAVFGVLIAAIIVVAEVTRRVFRPQVAPQAVAGEPAAFGSAGVLRVAGALQFATAAVALFVPLAAGLYLLVTVIWTLVQRLVLRRIYPPLPPRPTGATEHTRAR
ncbi:MULTISPECIES: YidC/Oxa1 family membrane protein insertase [unclassified Microbacterium]|uniref:YidC/Oxa1 family membrane protein insertase n=1 Tax=unclassified Microbacterium TaxID=2609290 RepID=UPI003744B809